jgi:hypothetical protein
MENNQFESLLSFLAKIPSLSGSIASGVDDGMWWVKFAININHEIAWKTIQELSYVLNYLSVEERLPTSFYPVSPPPYLNGGPESYLSWVIENTDKEFTPHKAFEWLESRLPDPVDDLDEWED